MKVITVSIRKGGTGKTTTALELAIGTAILGGKVLLIDCDSQCDLTDILCTEKPTRTLYHLLAVPDLVQLQECITHVRDDVWLLPAERRIKDEEDKLTKHRIYDTLYNLTLQAEVFSHIIIDCPPGEGALQDNAVYAADDVIIPVKCDYLSYKGVKPMMEIVTEMNGKVGGLLPTFYDERRVIDREVMELLYYNFPDLVLEPIRQCTQISQAQALHTSIFEHSRSSNPALDYMDLVVRYI